ncbi:MAG: prepilin-type N-terminal cleavage/methylation domain-containing protein, partial [Deltaproteobacteria bacterium]
MTLRFSPPSPRAGFSLLEVLVVLTILAMMAALAFASLRPPSEKLRLSRVIATLEKR